MPKSDRPRTFKEFCEWVRQFGYQVEMKGRTNHGKVVRENGSFVASIPGSPSDRRTILNLASDVRKVALSDATGRN